MGYGLTLVTAPTVEPISVAEAKKQCEIADAVTHHDSAFGSLITAARQFIERTLNRQLCTATWDLKLDRFPCGTYDAILVPLAPLVSVTAITYLDSAGTSTTWTSTNYRVSTSREPGRIVPVVGQTYPTTYNTTDAVTVRFVAGYGVASTVPTGIKQAILLLVTHWFENRSPVGSVGSEIAFSLQALLHSYNFGDEFLSFGTERREVLA